MKTRYTDLNSLNLLIVYFLLTITIVLSSYFLLDQDDWVTTHFLAVVVNFLLFSIVATKLNFKWISLSSFFLIFLIIFHQSHLLLSVINFDFNYFTNFTQYYDTTSSKEIFFYSYLIISFFSLGILIKLIVRKKEPQCNNNQTNIKVNNDIIRILGSILFLLFLPVAIYLDFNKLQISSTSGYLDSLSFGTSGILSIFSSWSFFGLIMMVLSISEKNRKVSLWLLRLAIIYILLTMLAGGRGTQMVKIFFLIYIYHKVFNKITFKKALIVLIGLYLFSGFSSAIALVRADGISSLTNFAEFFINTLVNNNPFGLILAETGSNIETVYHAMNNFPSRFPYAYGKSYIYSFLTVLPNINGFLDSLLPKLEFIRLFNVPTLGGSYVAELYYNFGWAGPLFSIFFGYFIQKISDKSDEYLDKKNYYAFSFFVPLFLNVLWLARNYFASIPRPFVWSSIMLITGTYILRQLLKNNKTNSLQSKG